MRKDAERNRQRLIAVAAEAMRTEGGDISMQVIADRAGLTRGTLYKNFAHRQAMYEAVLENELGVMSQRLSEECDADPLAFIFRMTELMMVYDKFLVALSAMSDYDAGKNQSRMIAAISASLARAQAEGRLDRRITGEDILMACRMLASHWQLDDQKDRRSTIDRRLSLFLRGLGPNASVE